MSSDPYETEREKRRKMQRARPAQIETAGAGQESVWDYPRPPRVEPVNKRVRVELDGVVLADSLRAYRVCETASPPVYYIPPEDVRMEHLAPTQRSTFCEWKGVARYWTATLGQRVIPDAAWSYPNPSEGYEVIRDHLAFYAGKMDACTVGDDRVTPQPGSYYGGWITPNLAGPFKGGRGSEGW
jgi:uncharacterized protein (DUF427 family)